jgi:predicted TIM-barrel fold metal-dependent hydrolase
MLIIDGHIHIFNRINGRNSTGKTASDRNGRIRTNSIVSAFIPPCPGKTAFTLNELSDLMARYGVEKAVIVQNPMIGNVNDEIERAVVNAPEKFAGAIQVDPRSGNAIAKIRRYSRVPGFRAVKLEMSEGWGWTGIYKGMTYSDEGVKAVVKAAADNGLHVMIDPGPIGNPGYDLMGISIMVDLYPNTIFQIEHLGYMVPTNEKNPNDIAQWNQCIDLGSRKNVYIGYSAVGSLLEEEYPCEKSLRLLEYAVSRIGEDKIIWGTDAPVTLNKYTYTQMIDSVLYHTSLNALQISKIVGINVEKLYFFN